MLAGRRFSSIRLAAGGFYWGALGFQTGDEPFSGFKLSKRRRAELGPAGEKGKLCKIILGQAAASISVLVLALSEGWELLLCLAREALLEGIVLIKSEAEGGRCWSSR